MLALAYQCRMFVIERTRDGSEEVPEEVIVMAGSTGNLYDVVIGLEPSCTCPDYMNGNHCKHIIYVCKNLTQRPKFRLIKVILSTTLGSPQRSKST